MKLRISFAAAAVLALVAQSAAASTGVCDSNPPTSTEACIQAVLNSGGVVNDIFKDANGLTADQLPVFGKVFNNWPNCPEHIDFAGAGHSNAPYDCPGEYSGVSVTPTYANAGTYLNALDRQWWQPCRLADPTIVNGCPANYACIADGVGGSYDPWEGLVFDLGGPSNQVAIFAENDHGPQPCESLEYTVYLTDNPFAQDLVQDPKNQGVDPDKWNRAVLTKIFTKGFTEVRPPDPAGHASCGDTNVYSVEEDSFVQVFSLPCGINFRYASIIAGNDGLDFPACGYDSEEAELDAVAGLTESGSAVCPDADGDHYVDCNCPNHPPVCDCDDADPGVHPGAPEACDSVVDMNCDGQPGACPSPDLVCNQGLCLSKCTAGENPYCAPGFTCTHIAQGNVCVPIDCGCKPGEICVNDQCVDACAGVVCPGAQVCQDGQCIDPCANIQCPQGELCENGQCIFPCGCFAGDLGCADQPGLVCDGANGGACVPPSCKGVVCNAGEVCDGATGTCVSLCNANVVCPSGEKCKDGAGCVPNCTDVTCADGLTCDPKTGTCVDTSCDDVTCLPPGVCMHGQCVDQGSGAGGAGGDASGAGGMGGATTGAGGAASTGSGKQDPGDTGGCGCRAAGSDETPAGPAGALALLGIAAVLARRRRGG